MKRALLGEAMCVELSTKMDTRAQQLAKNANMVEQANGSLAPIHGQESFLTHPKVVFIPREGCGLVFCCTCKPLNMQGFLHESQLQPRHCILEGQDRHHQVRPMLGFDREERRGEERILPLVLVVGFRLGRWLHWHLLR